MSDLKSRIQTANIEVVRRMTESRPLWVDVRKAGDVIPGLHRNLILHAGPPISWDRMCPPQRNAVSGAAVYEGLARRVDEAAAMVAAGDIALSPCHAHRAVGSMCGATSFSMPVLVARNETFGTEAYCHLYEHPDREKLSYGAYSPRVHDNLKWLEDVLAPALGTAIRASGGLDVRSMIARSLTMGDECHSRNFAGTAILVTELGPHLAPLDIEPKIRAEIMDFLRRCSQFALHVVMAGCKTVADAAGGVEYSTIVTAMARNGVETGIRVSGLGDRWFTGPAGEITGLYFTGYRPEDGQADLGDSAITETVGLGAFAHAASPGLALVKSPSARDALQFTEQMRPITVGENANFAIPYLDARGTPTGIDIRLVVETGTTPIINTAAADRQGRGQIGVGNARAPMEAFRQALRAFGARYA